MLSEEESPLWEEESPLWEEEDFHADPELGQRLEPFIDDAAVERYLARHGPFFLKKKLISALKI